MWTGDVDCDQKSVEILRAAADRLFPGLEKVAFEEHLKSFYHYVLMQDEEQRRQSVLLLDGWSEEELVLYSLSYNKKTRPIVCFPEELRLKIPAEADAAQKDQILCSAVRGLMQEKEYSAAYLTGEALGGRLDEGVPESDLQRKKGLSGRYAVQ